MSQFWRGRNRLDRIPYDGVRDMDALLGLLPAPHALSGGCGGEPRRMRITHYIWGLGPGGAERQCAYMARGLRGRGHDARVLLGEMGSAMSRHYLPLLSDAGVPCEALDSARCAEFLDRLGPGKAYALMRRIPPDLRHLVVDVASQIERHRPDILYCWMDLTNIIGAWAAYLTGVPKVVMAFRSLSPPNYPYYPSYRWLHAQYRALIRPYRVALHANSMAGAANYAAWLGLAPEQIQVIHNAIDLAGTPSPAEGEARAFRRELGADDGTPLLAGVFRLSSEKRPLVFAEVVARTRRLVPNLRVAHAGIGPLEGEFRDALRRLGLTDCVTMMGRRPDIPVVLAASDALLMTSSIEGFPNALLEAQLFGCPPVASGVGDVGVVVEHGRTGFVHAPDDLDGMARSLASLLVDPALRARMARAGRERVVTRYPLEKMTGTVARACLGLLDEEEQVPAEPGMAANI